MDHPLNDSSLRNPLRKAEMDAMKQQLLAGLQNTSRDHLATISDEVMLETMHQSWPAWRQFLEQAQRDMAKYPQNENDAVQLNLLHFMFQQLMNRIIEAVERGDAIRGSKV